MTNAFSAVRSEERTSRFWKFFYKLGIFRDFWSPAEREMDTQQDAEPDGTNNNSQMKVEPQVILKYCLKRQSRSSTRGYQVLLKFEILEPAMRFWIFFHFLGRWWWRWRRLVSWHRTCFSRITSNLPSMW